MTDPISPDRMAFLRAIDAAPWDDEVPRGVYADWLDEHGEHEEATRQRRWVTSARWLWDFARRHDDDFSHWWPKDERDDDKTIRPAVITHGELILDLYPRELNTGWAKLLYFLRRHTDGDHYLPFDTPYGFGDYSDELWEHYEVVTDSSAPTHTDTARTEMPPFRCAC